MPKGCKQPFGIKNISALLLPFLFFITLIMLWEDDTYDHAVNVIVMAMVLGVVLECGKIAFNRISLER